MEILRGDIEGMISNIDMYGTLRQNDVCLNVVLPYRFKGDYESQKHTAIQVPDEWFTMVQWSYMPLTKPSPFVPYYIKYDRPMLTYKGFQACKTVLRDSFDKLIRAIGTPQNWHCDFLYRLGSKQKLFMKYDKNQHVYEYLMKTWDDVESLYEHFYKAMAVELEKRCEKLQKEIDSLKGVNCFS